MTRRVTPAGGPWWRHPALGAALIGFALYLPTVTFSWVWDDHPLIEQNLLLRDGASLLRQLGSDFWLTSGANTSGFWRPLISLTYAVDGALWQWRPVGFHLMNALAHGGVSALVALLVVAGGGGAWAALAAGAWFAAMPAHVESVAWIAGRTDVYCALFFLLAVVLDRRARRSGRRWPGGLALVALGLALASKEAAVTFVLVAAVAEWSEPRGPVRERIRWLMPYLALTLVYLLLHRLWVAPPPVPAHPPAGLQARTPAGVALMFPAYVQFLWPWFRHTPAVTLDLSLGTPLRVTAAIAVHLGFVAGLVALIRRRSTLALPLATFWLTLLPLFAINLGAGILLFSERFFYLPSAGAAWAAGALIGVLPARATVRWAALAVVAALAVGSAAETARILPVWKNDARLFESMTVTAPENYMGRTQWARILALAGRDDEAKIQLDAADRIDPTRPDAPSVRAMLAYRQHRPEDALRFANLSIERGSAQVEPRLMRAVALMSMGRLEEARVTIEEMRARSPGNVNIGTLWGQYLLTSGDARGALPFLERSAQYHPDDVNLIYALGLARAGTGRAAEAQRAFRRVVELVPDYYDAWLQIATLDMQAGDRAGASAALDHAAALPMASDGRAAALRAKLGGMP